MIEIRYSAPHSLDIVGTVVELQMVRQKILDLIESNDSQITLDLDAAIDPSPYNSALEKLVIVKGHCPTRISLKDEKQILVEGSLDCLKVFASFFDFKSDAKKGDHSHYEYYEGNDWIAADSIPLVVDVK